MTKFKKVIVTAGSTIDWIDPVRYISNASTGKMGFCIAYEFSKKVKTVYIKGNVDSKYSKINNLKDYNTKTNLEMKEAILNEIDHNTMLIMAAAPLDFKLKDSKNQKIKKSNSLKLNLNKNEDILLSISKEKKIRNIKNLILVGFCAETQKLEENAKYKLKAKNLDFIIANYISKKSGFGEKNTSIEVFGRNSLYFSIQNTSKEEIAKKLSAFLLNF